MLSWEDSAELCARHAVDAVYSRAGRDRIWTAQLRVRTSTTFHVDMQQVPQQVFTATGGLSPDTRHQLCQTQRARSISSWHCWVNR